MPLIKIIHFKSLNSCSKSWIIIQRFKRDRSEIYPLNTFALLCDTHQYFSGRDVFYYQKMVHDSLNNTKVTNKSTGSHVGHLNANLIPTPTHSQSTPQYQTESQHQPVKNTELPLHHIANLIYNTLMQPKSTVRWKETWMLKHPIMKPISTFCCADFIKIIGVGLFWWQYFRKAQLV